MHFHVAYMNTYGDILGMASYPHKDLYRSIDDFIHLANCWNESPSENLTFDEVMDAYREGTTNMFSQINHAISCIWSRCYPDRCIESKNN